MLLQLEGYMLSILVHAEAFEWRRLLSLLCSHPAPIVAAAQSFQKQVAAAQSFQKQVAAAHSFQKQYIRESRVSRAILMPLDTAPTSFRTVRYVEYRVFPLGDVTLSVCARKQDNPHACMPS
jgi:hypothetical protein